MINFRWAVIPAMILMASCGSSSDDNSADSTPTPADSANPTLNDPAAIEPDPMTGQEINTEPDQAPDPEPDPAADPGPDPTTDPEAEPDSTTDTDPVADPPTMQDRVRLYFSIELPYFPSSQYRVQVTWDEINIEGEDDGSSLWKAIGNFPTDEEHLLVVNFYDESSDVVLGSFETMLRTEINDVQTVIISTSDFEVALWDDDADGVSNYDEVRNGTDPLTFDQTADTPMFSSMDFTITVPQHMSNELRVTVSWGELQFDAQWQGDELWTAVSDRFVVGRTDTLIVDFYDRNGEVKLGSYRRLLSVFLNGLSTTTIDEEFDTRSWDDDTDGRNNFDEVRAGTDPLVADAGPAPATLLDSFSFNLDNRWLATLEPRFQALNLPAMFSEQIVTGTGTSRKVEDVTYDFSADGNGTYSSSSTFEIEADEGSTFTQSAERTVQGNSVNWTGSNTFLRSDIRLERVYNIASSLNDGEFRQIVSMSDTEITRPFSGNPETYWVTETEYDLVLDLDSIDEENLCLALSGSITQTRTRRGIPSTPRSAERESRFERWVVAGNDPTRFGRYPNATETDTLDVRVYCNVRFSGQ